MTLNLKLAAKSLFFLLIALVNLYCYPSMSKTDTTKINLHSNEKISKLQPHDVEVLKKLDAVEAEIYKKLKEEKRERDINTIKTIAYICASLAVSIAIPIHYVAWKLYALDKYFRSFKL